MHLTRRKREQKIVLPQICLAAAVVAVLILRQCGILLGKVYTVEDFNMDFRQAINLRI